MDQSDFDDLMRRQNMMLRSVADESETDSKIKLMDIINDLVTDRNKKVHKEAVILEAGMRGMPESEVERVLSLLKEDHMIIEPEPGFIRRA
jgi:DNA replicative helicase MCM subunit Mcm2 (Cdc46/Mcm family)